MSQQFGIAYHDCGSADVTTISCVGTGHTSKQQYKFCYNIGLCIGFEKY